MDCIITRLPKTPFPCDKVELSLIGTKDTYLKVSNVTHEKTWIAAKDNMSVVGSNGIIAIPRTLTGPDWLDAQKHRTVFKFEGEVYLMCRNALGFPKVRGGSEEYPDRFKFLSDETCEILYPRESDKDDENR